MFLIYQVTFKKPMIEETQDIFDLLSKVSITSIEVLMCYFILIFLSKNKVDPWFDFLILHFLWFKYLYFILQTVFKNVVYASVHRVKLKGSSSTI